MRTLWNVTLWLFAAVIALQLGAVAKEPHGDYQTGTLVDITHADSSRVVQNTYSGSVQSVTDREYDIAVQVGDMTYVGSYWPRFRWSYQPTDLTVNTELKVKLTKNEMYILRDDGKELRTKIIKRIANKTH